MTLNQVVRRIQTLVLSHKQIRRFKTGLVGDWFADQTAKYPACCLQYNAGNISTSGHSVVVNFRMILVDMVHVSQDTNLNLDDVLSDLLLVLMDLIAEMNLGQFSDWRLSGDNTISGVENGSVIEAENDLVAGWAIDFTITSPFTQNVCQIPTDLFDFPDGDDSGAIGTTTSKDVFDVTYIATGGEINPSIPEIIGMKVLLIVRGGQVIYKVSSSPDSTEYIWNDIVLTLGVAAEPGQRFIILYRKY